MYITCGSRLFWALAEKVGTQFERDTNRSSGYESKPFELLVCSVYVIIIDRKSACLAPFFLSVKQIRQDINHSIFHPVTLSNSRPLQLRWFCLLGNSSIPKA